MAATPSVKITKQMTFRGSARRWSNRYHFAGGTPPDTAHWTQLFDNVTAAEKLALSTRSTIVEAIGYAAGSEVPVASKTYSLAGQRAAGTYPQQGEVAALVRYATAARSQKNHPVYLMNYYHGVDAASAIDPDSFLAASLATYATYAAAWIAGFSDGATTYNRAGPNGASATGYVVEPLLTHRDFPR